MNGNAPCDAGLHLLYIICISYRFFPPDLFEMFIDIGHYIREISAYEDLVSKLNSLPVSAVFKSC